MIPDRCSFKAGSLDYTKERHDWLPDYPDEIISSLMERQKKRKGRKTFLTRPVFYPLFYGVIAG